MPASITSGPSPDKEPLPDNAALRKTDASRQPIFRVLPFNAVEFSRMCKLH